MFIPFGEIGLGKLSEDDRRLFLEFVESRLTSNEKVEPVNKAQMVRKGMGWETISKAADAAEIIGFIYLVSKGAHKTLRFFYELAKEWSERNNKSYDAKEVEKFVEFMEKDNNSGEKM